MTTHELARKLLDCPPDLKVFIPVRGDFTAAEVTMVDRQTVPPNPPNVVWADSNTTFWLCGNETEIVLLTNPESLQDS